jgi:hypothetical protein
LIVRATAVLVAALGSVLLLIVANDAAFILPLGARRATPWVLVAVALLVTVGAVWALLRLTPLRIARLLENDQPELGTSLTNAVQLADLSFHAPISEYLRCQAVELGGDIARRARVWPVIKRGWIGVQTLLGALALLWLIGLTVFGDVFSAVMPRLLDPSGDHPPYSRVKFVVEPQRVRVAFGGQFDVQAKVSGAPVEKLYLMAEGAGGTTKTVMFRRPDKSYLQTLTNLRQPMHYWVTDGRGRSQRYPVEIVFTPKIEFVEVTTEYPAYTHLATRTHQLIDSEMRVPKHSVLDLRVASNRPLASGRVVLTPLLGGKAETITLPPTAEHDRMVAGRFEVTEALAYTVSVTDTDELDSDDNYQGRIVIEADHPPRLQVMEPARQAVATPDAIVNVSLRAEDDYGVDQVVWFRGFNESIERPFRIPLASLDTPTRVDAHSAFNLEDLGVKPGDTIDYFFEVADNDPDGPNVTTSRMHSLQVVSREQYEQVLRQAMARRALFDQYLKLDDFLRRLAEQAQSLHQLAKSGSPETAQQAESLASDIQQYLNALDTALAQPQLFDVESAFRKQLEQQRARMRRMLDSLNAGAGAGGGQLDPDMTQQLAEQFAEMTRQMSQQVGEPARQIVQVVRLTSLANKFAVLTLQQQELAKRAHRYEDKQGDLSRTEQMALAELAAAQQRIHDEVDQLLTEVPQLVVELPAAAEFDKLRTTALAFVDAANKLDIRSELAAAHEKLAMFDGATGYAIAESAYKKMDSLVKHCQSMPGEGKECLAAFQPELMQAGLGNSIDQIMAAISGSASGSSRDGYGLFGEAVSLYGPDIELPAGAEGTGAEMAEGTAANRHVNDHAAEDSEVPRDTDPHRVQLQRDTPFPLQYRQLVGEYFRAVAESDSEDVEPSP